MINKNQVRILMQYVDALEEASEKLEETYNEKNIEGMKKVKEFMLEVKSKIDILLR